MVSALSLPPFGPDRKESQQGIPDTIEIDIEVNGERQTLSATNSKGPKATCLNTLEKARKIGGEKEQAFETLKKWLTEPWPAHTGLRPARGAASRSRGA